MVEKGKDWGRKWGDLDDFKKDVRRNLDFFLHHLNLMLLRSRLVKESRDLDEKRTILAASRTSKKSTVTMMESFAIDKPNEETLKL
ncbi:hypothetical protein SADUNF_Sadunf05G0033200 [Salix dunnii]|uniref:Uncharacterized protein n=1 Tax=Salix dunnii TaxID=1413687 RepID=A0A835K6J2_9ROSI|nr:hypothetical protein SADUNF_Sadunf05G0033200 [Salix dunnii]